MVWPWVGDVCRLAMSALGIYANVNLYATAAGATVAVPPHSDRCVQNAKTNASFPRPVVVVQVLVEWPTFRTTRWMTIMYCCRQDVMILQLEGSKRWKLYHPSVALPRLEQVRIKNPQPAILNLGPQTSYGGCPLLLYHYQGSCR